MTEREKNIAQIVGVALVAFAGWWAFDAFYFQPRADLEKQVASEKKKLADDRKAIREDPEKQLEFVRMNLFNTGPEAAGVISRIYTLADADGFNITNWASGGTRISNKSDIDEVRFTLSGQGGTPSLGKFLLSLQRVSRLQDGNMLPIRIDEIGITTRKEGLDQLQATIGVTALVFDPKNAQGRGGRSGTMAPSTQSATASSQPAGGPRGNPRGGTTNPGRGPTTITATTGPVEDPAVKAEMERQMRERKIKEEEAAASRAAAASQASTQPVETQPATGPGSPRAIPATQPTGGAP